MEDFFSDLEHKKKNGNYLVRIPGHFWFPTAFLKDVILSVQIARELINLIKLIKFLKNIPSVHSQLILKYLSRENFNKVQSSF